MLRWIYNQLVVRRNKERHKVLQLQWQKALLEQKIEQAKREHHNN